MSQLILDVLDLETGDPVPPEHRQGAGFISAFKALLFVLGLCHKLSASSRMRIKPPERHSTWLLWLSSFNI